VQSYTDTPCPVWNPDVDSPIDFYDSWQEFAPGEAHENAFKAEWELFLRHVVGGEPFRWSLFEGAKGLQLVEMGEQSWRERRWVVVPKLDELS
jgi:predicted dehydrogenase